MPVAGNGQPVLVFKKVKPDLNAAMTVDLRQKLYRCYEFLYYQQVIFGNRLKKIFQKKANNHYLFILAPPFSGSTLLNELLSTSSCVSTNNALGTREGQQLPGVRKLLWESNNKYDPEAPYDWPFIRRQWLKYWDITKPVLLEKSPPNIVRATALAHHFVPASFIIMVRDPYAVCESMIRRGQNAAEAAAFAVRCLRFQKQNIEKLQRFIFFRYEELTDAPENVREKLIAFMPALQDLDIHRIFKAHNFKNAPMPIGNMNHEKVANLSPTQLAEINAVFKQNEHILAHFNYYLHTG